jgi:hypothetical protein
MPSWLKIYRMNCTIVLKGDSIELIQHNEFENVNINIVFSLVEEFVCCARTKLRPPPLDLDTTTTRHAHRSQC